MAWRLVPTSLSGKGTAGRNALDNLEFLVYSSNIAADSALSEISMMQFVTSMIGKGSWQNWKNGYYFGTLLAGVFTYGISYIGPDSFVSISPTIVDHIDRELIDAVHGTWRINVVYRDAVYTRQTGDAAFSFSTTSGKQHIVSGIGGYSASGLTNGFPRPGVTLPTDISLIGCGTVGQPPQGIDIDVPTFKFKSEYFVAASKIQAILNAITSLKGPVNSQIVTITVRGLIITSQIGELKFCGVEGQERIGQGDWSLVLHWEKNPNLTGLTVGGITGISKAGWDYLEAVSFPYADTGANMQSQRVAYVLVHPVYIRDDLNAIIPSSGGIGLAPPWGQTPGSSLGP